MGIFARFFKSNGPRSSQYQWILERIGETETAPAARTQRSVQDLLDALGSLRGTGTKGVFGRSAGALTLGKRERQELQERIRTTLRSHRDAFEKAGDAVSLLELSKFADSHDLPELRLVKPFVLRCDPLGEPNGLSAEWQSLLVRLRHARDDAESLRWSRLTEFFADQGPSSVAFGEPDEASLREFALRYEQERNQAFSRELAAVWSVVNGICLDDMYWYLLPVSEWSWEEDGLQIGSGHYSQGRLCLTAGGGSSNLALAEVLDIDDDGVIGPRYPNSYSLLDALLPSS